MRLTESGKPSAARQPLVAAAQRIAGGLVVSYSPGGSDPATHENVTRRRIAQQIAALHGYEFGGDYDASRAYDAPLYFVPAETLLLERAHALGIGDEKDIFGGVVPFPFVATKTITHPLASAGASAPAGWSDEFARAVGGAVVPGYAAFSREDARRGGECLLERGPVRVKPALAVGGRGQVVAEDAQALREALEDLDSAALAQCGVVVEQNLTEVTTYSVGQVRVAELVATYFGTQKLARDHNGLDVYGGSALNVARGGFDALLALDIEPAAREAIEQARTYDAAASCCFAGFFASRRNYDIVSGRDGSGALLSGVLEQSWRIGGASSAEIVALEAFRNDPALRAVRAECTESYDENEALPRHARVYFRGIDRHVGFITKYTTVVPYGDT